MKRTLGFSSLMLVLALAMLIWSSESPALADVPQQRLATPTSTPFSSSDLPHASPVMSTIVGLKWQGSPLSKARIFAKSYPVPPPNPGDLVDNWNLVVHDAFETTFPITSSCVITEGTFYGPRQGRLWGQDTYHAFSGAKSIWPARGGPNGLDPSASNYPPGLDSWLICGPYDFTYAQFMQVNFTFWREFTDPNDFMGVVYSTSGSWWDGVLYPGLYPLPTPQWVTQTLTFPVDGGQLIEGQPQVWFGLVFRSNSDGNTGKGVWVDDLEIWRYYKPITTCASLDLGNKGVNIVAYDKIGGVNYPTIRAGDTQVVQGLMAAGAHWVRLPILQNNGVFIDTQAYDRMIDTLCNAGISTMPLFNHESLTRSVSDANSTDPSIAASYRNDFANRANWLAGHFKGRVKYWQVWNEPVEFYPLSDSRYAALLTQTASSIKLADPNAKIVGAGLDQPWNAQNIYLNQVYDKLNNEQGRARPFDLLAIHLYNYLLQGYNIDPVAYMHQTQEMNATLGDRAITDKFVRTMEGNQDTGKKVWVSELGWNSSTGRQNAPIYAVDPIHQAYYLKSSFDILFNEARSVEKIFWYKYMDENVETNQPTLERIRNGEVWLINHPDLQSVAPSIPSVVVPGFWGLYTTVKLEPKPSRCAFLYYPQRCPDLPWFNYLPLILKGQ